MTSMIPWFNKYTHTKQNIELFPAKQKPNYCMNYFLTQVQNRAMLTINEISISEISKYMKAKIY